MGTTKFMTVRKWQTARSTLAMLLELGPRKSPWKWSTRKERLFACACCRRVWYLLKDPADRKAVELAERVADKEIRLADLRPAHEKTKWIRLAHDDNWRGQGRMYYAGDPKWGFGAWIDPKGQIVCRPAHCASIPSPRINVDGAADDSRALLYFRVSPQAAYDEEIAQCALLRDIVGDRPELPSINPDWLAWSNGLLPKMALAIYEGREFDRLPVLGDALEDAGCSDSAILNHCRTGEHVRGCWLIDKLIGKS